MEQIRKCRQLICGHQEEQIQQKITESYAADYNQRRKLKKLEKQKPRLKEKQQFENVFSFRSNGGDTLYPQLQKQNAFFNTSPILIKDLLGEGFNKKPSQKISMKQHENRVHFSPQLNIPHSPSRKVHFVYHQNDPCTTTSAQVVKQKFHKVSAAGKISCKEKGSFCYEQEGLQRKVSEKSSDFSTKQSEIIVKNEGETFQNTFQINSMNEGMRKVGNAQRQSDQVKRIQKCRKQQLKKVGQLSVINRQQFKNNPANSNNLCPINRRSLTQTLQNKVENPSTPLPINYQSVHHYLFADKTPQTQEILILKKKQSNRILAESSVTFRTFIESLEEEHFVDSNPKKEEEENKCPKKSSYLKQNERINNQSVLKDMKGESIKEQEERFERQIPSRQRQPYHHPTTFIGQPNLRSKDMCSPLSKQFSDIRTMQSIYSQRLQKSYVDTNYMLDSRGKITKLV